MTNDSTQDQEFLASFNDTASSEGGDNFGLLPGEEAESASPAATDAAETAGPAEGSAPAVVIVAEAGEGAEGAAPGADEGGETAAAVADAKGANDAHNEAAAINGKDTGATTGEQEAAAAAGGESAAPAAADAGETVAVATDPAAALEGDEPTDPKEIQRQKSWEGRLRAEEARLKKLAADLEAKSAGTGESPAAAGADAISDAAQEAAADGKPEMAQAAQELAAQVESGEMTFEEAVSQLSEDFGPTFTKMIEVASTGFVNRILEQRLGAVDKKAEDIISHITDNAERSHFETISDAHPDFLEVAEDPAFQEFVASKGAEKTVESGSARQIVKLLTEFKDSKPAGDTAVAAAPDAPVADAVSPAQDAVAAAQEAAPVDSAAADAAEGVRSAGLRIPDRPAAAAEDDFAAAWEQA